MNIVITGGGGFLGSRLARKLVSKDKHNHITLFDAAFGAEVPGARAVKGDIADPASLGEVVKGEIDTVFHLAAVVSGAAEADFDLGMRVNLEGTKNLLERCRKLPRPPKVVFSSSVAAFGGDLPPELDDSTTPTPQTSYGTQKVMGEYLIADYSRKGYIDGRSLRLPTIVVRAGRPNAAASSFASAIIREPLNGVPLECPVGPQTGIWLLSPRRVVDAFIHAAELPASAWPSARVVNLPGITATVDEMLKALERVAGEKVKARVSFKPDARIEAIVRTWPVRFRTPRALAMGFKPDADAQTLIRDYIEDENIKVKA
jgi:nucleoside-diphosphate-sugar epimerase